MRPLLSAAELQTVSSYFSPARRIFEYGCGGSTYFAITQTKADIVSVESDAIWIAKLRADPVVSDAERRKRLRIIHADIGPTGDWGSPLDRSNMSEWPRYPAAPWKTESRLYHWARRFNVTTPDVVFVDGRFRVSCILTAVAKATRGTHIIVHDFWNRPHYHSVLPFLDTVERADTLGVFRKRDNVDGRKLKEARDAFALEWA